jgi:hypothetical protein
MNVLHITAVPAKEGRQTNIKNNYACQGNKEYGFCRMTVKPTEPIFSLGYIERGHGIYYCVRSFPRAKLIRSSMPTCLAGLVQG